MSGLQLKTKVEESVESPVIPIAFEDAECAGVAAAAVPSAPAVAEPEGNPTAEPPPLPPRAAQVAAARSAAVSAGSGRSLAGPVAVILALLLLLGGVVGSGWYLLNRGGESALATKVGGLAREAGLASPAIPAASISEPSVVAAGVASVVEVAAPELDEEAMFRAAYDIEWPVLVLTGMVAGASPKHTSAILNGNLVAARETIEGAMLIEIRDGGAVLEYERTRKFIRVGEST